MANETAEIALLGTEPRLCVMYAGRGEAVFFLHGLGSTKENWEKQLDHFADRYYVMAWDARGYGGSDSFEGKLEFSRHFVRDLEDVLDALRIERAHLVGLSMGGLIAQCFYFSRPARVATLTLADTFPFFGALGPETVARFTASRLQPLLDGSQPAEMATSAVDALMAPNASKEARAKLHQSLTSLRKDQYIKTIQGLLEQAAPGDLSQIKVPTLVMVGEHDALSPIHVSAELAKNILNSELVIIEGAGHMSNMECPDAFNASLSAFLTRHEGRATRVVGR